MLSALKKIAVFCLRTEWRCERFGGVHGRLVGNSNAMFCNLRDLCLTWWHLRRLMHLMHPVIAIGTGRSSFRDIGAVL